MSQENSNMSAPSCIGKRSPEYSALIEWYDSPGAIFRSQTRIHRGVFLKKNRSEDDFSPSLSAVDDLPSTSNFDFDKLWCADSPKENTTPSRKSDNAAVSHFNGIAENESNSATPHRRRGMNRLSARRTRNKTEDPKLDEKKPVISGNFLSMEEGLAIGKASLVKLRQRLHSVGNSNIYKTSQDDNLCGLSPKKVSQNSPNVSPISSTTTSKRNTDVLLTPSMARTQNFSCSTPKTSLATPASLKRFRTMNDSSTCDQGERIKMARTKSMDDANDTSDDDSFLDDIFVPFTHPSQFVQMLKQGFLKK